MKTVFLALTLSASFNFAHAYSEAKAIVIQGAAADYLYEVDKKLNMTVCYLSVLRSGQSIPECELNIYSVTQDGKDIVIDGFAASEFYRLGIRSDSVSCFISHKADGSSRVGCKLKAKILRRNY